MNERMTKRETDGQAMMDCDAWKRNVGIVDSQNGHCFEHDIDTNGQDFCSYGEYQTNTGGVTE